MSLQSVSPRSISSIIVEPRVLVRDSLNSLVTSYSYRVVGSYASAFDIRDTSDNPEGDRPNLAIIGAQSIERAIDEALRVRELFADSKIVVLLETVSAEDIQRMSEPTIDACIPLYASQDVLIRMLEVVTSGSARVVVLADAPHATQGSKSPLRRGGCAGALQKPRDVDDEGTETSEGRSTNDPADDGDSLAASLLMPGRDEEASNGHSLAAAAFDGDAPKRPCTNAAHFANGANSAHRYAWKAMVPNAVQRHSLVRSIRDNDELNGSDAATATRGPKISDRELQILDGLVKGHGNKMIARECAITEATVKVHMKSILRKICVANRTQAAIWALEHGYCSHLPEARNIGRSTNGIAARAVMREQDL